MAVEAFGRVSRVYPQDNIAYIQLSPPGAGDPQVRPKNNYFVLHQNQAVFPQSFALVLSAAERRDVLHIRTVQDINVNEFADIGYLYVNYS
jgi:hypothetical protein